VNYRVSLKVAATIDKRQRIGDGGEVSSNISRIGSVAGIPSGGWVLNPALLPNATEAKFITLHVLQCQ